MRLMCVCSCFKLMTAAHQLAQYDEDVGRATGSGELQEDFMSNLSRISQLTGIIIALPPIIDKVNLVIQQVSQILYMQKRMLKCTVLISC